MGARRPSSAASASSSAWWRASLPRSWLVRSTPSSELLGIVAGCAILFVAGFVDDLYTLKPIAKLAAQFAAAASCSRSGLTVEIVGNDVLATALGLVWLVGITNAFNLLDNMDGLAASLAHRLLRALRGRRPRPGSASSRSSSRSRSAAPASASSPSTCVPAAARASSWATPAAR